MSLSLVDIKGTQKITIKDIVPGDLCVDRWNQNNLITIIAIEYVDLTIMMYYNVTAITSNQHLIQDQFDKNTPVIVIR